MEFVKFRDLIIAHIKRSFNSRFFHTEVSGDEMYETYLAAFPKGKNETFRKRPEFDCNSCRRFIKVMGNAVDITKDNKIVSVWDIELDDEVYGPVLKAMSEKAKSKKVQDIFLHYENNVGVNCNIDREDPKIKWYHLFYELPNTSLVPNKDIPTEKAKYRDNQHVLNRSLEEFSIETVETVLELIAQNSLYRGEEFKGVLESFLTIQKEYKKVPAKLKHNYTWRKSLLVGPAVARIRNHSIGQLLRDIEAGTDLDDSVKKYEAIVAPTNYKRPKAVFTKKMLEDAKKQVVELGLEDSLPRRFATLEDITVNNILFANKDVSKKISGSVFDEMEKDVSVVSEKTLSKVEEISIEDFIKNIIPSAKTVEALFENNHSDNLVSLIAPVNKTAKTMFKWNNNFSWAYSGNITDSMKENVKKAGGKVEGDLRFSIQWNDKNDNHDDLDAHCNYPGNGKIFYGNKDHNRVNSGSLDVDIIHPQGVAVENIIFTDKSKMKDGEYKFLVNCFSSTGNSKSGFTAEIEFEGQIFHFEYAKPLKYKENIEVATVKYSKSEGFKIVKSMDGRMSSKEHWGIKTNQFVPVNVMMFSPNYWDEQDGIGNRHYFFMLKDCKNEGTPNGFFNEFLKEEFMKHKRVFEALGSKMKVEESEDQLSGLGFSSTKRNSLVVKVSGKFNRMLKIKF